MSPSPATTTQTDEPAITSIRAVRLIALLEGLSFIALLICMIFKYAGPRNPLGVSIMGWIHGMLFLAYIAIFLMARGRHGWSWLRTGVYLLAAFIPFAPFFVRHAEPEPERT